jgi:hypothetical protein
MTDTELLDKLAEFVRSNDNNFDDLGDMLYEGINIRTAISVLGNPEYKNPSVWEFTIQMRKRLGDEEWSRQQKERLDKIREEIYSWRP